MTRARITVKGLKELERKLRRLPAGMESGAEVAVKASAEAVYDDMRQGAPRSSGRLRDAIGRRQRGPLSVEVGVLGARRAWYAALVEFGTSSRPATPFAEPAARSEEQRFPDRIARAVRGELPR